MPTIPSIPYTFKNYQPGQAPQPILADQLNANFAPFAESANTLAFTLTGNTALTAAQAANGGYEFAGSLGAQATVTWPAYYGFLAIENTTSGGFSIVCEIAGSGGSAVTINNGEFVPVWSDGTNFVRLSEFGNAFPTTGTGPVVLQNDPTINNPAISGGSVTNAALDNITGLVLDATSGGGTFTVNTATTGATRTITLPDNSGTVLTTGSTGAITNSLLANSSLTVAGHTVALGGSTTLAASDLTNGTIGTGPIVLGSAASNILHVYAIGGQSNAEGQNGDPLQSPIVPHGFVLQYSGGVISDANDPVGNANPTSAWPAFGITYYNATGNRVMFVPSAVGGTDQSALAGVSTLNWDTYSQGSWGSQNTLAPRLVANVTAAMAAARTAGYVPIYCGILWAQGENDAGAISNNVSLPNEGSANIAGGPYPAGTTTITVTSATGLANGQFAVVTLTSGSTFTSAISVSGTTVTLSTPVPTGQSIPSGGSFHVYAKSDYQNAFQNMLAYFRSATTDGTTFPELPFYICQVGCPASGDTLGYQRVRQAQDEVAQADPYTKVVFRGAVDFAARSMMQEPYTFTGSISGTTLTVTAVNQSTTKIYIDAPLSGSGVTSGTFISALNGTGVGGTGTYSISPSQSASSTTITANIDNLHYTQEGYNEMGREMAKGVVAAQQTEGWLHQNYNVTRVVFGGTLTVGDTVTLNLASTALSTNPWGIGAQGINVGTTFASLAANVCSNGTIYSPPLQAVGISLTYTASATECTINIYQPVTLSPQVVTTVSWTGSGSETTSITNGTSAYGWSPNLYYNKGNITIGSAVQRPDLLSVDVEAATPITLGANVFPMGIFNAVAAGTENILLRLANTEAADGIDQRATLLFQPDYNLWGEFGELYGSIISSSNDGVSGVGSLEFGGYAAGSRVLNAGMPYNGGLWVGNAVSLTTRGAANGPGTATLANDVAAGTDNNLLFLINNAGNIADQRVGMLMQPTAPGGNNPGSASSLYGRTIMTLGETSTGRGNLTFGGYSNNTYAEHMRITQSGGLSLGLTSDPGAGNARINGFVGTNFGTSTPAGGSTTAGIFMGSSGVGLYWGSGAPTVSANQGSLYLRTDGSSTSTRLYVCEGGTTWTNFTSAA